MNHIGQKKKWNKMTKYSQEKNAAFRQVLIRLTDVTIKTN